MISPGEPRKRKRKGNFHFVHQDLIEERWASGPWKGGSKAVSVFHPFGGGHQRDRLSVMGGKEEDGSLSDINLYQRSGGDTCQGVLILGKLSPDINLNFTQGSAPCIIISLKRHITTRALQAHSETTFSEISFSWTILV